MSFARIAVGIGEPCPGCGQPYRFDHLPHILEKFFGETKPASDTLPPPNLTKPIRKATVADAMDLISADLLPPPRGYFCEVCEREWTRADYSPENGMCDSCCEKASGA